MIEKLVVVLGVLSCIVDEGELAGIAAGALVALVALGSEGFEAADELCYSPATPARSHLNTNENRQDYKRSTRHHIPEFNPPPRAVSYHCCPVANSNRHVATCQLDSSKPPGCPASLVRLR